MTIAVIGAIVAGVVIVATLFFLLTYTVVDPNKAHIVVVMGGGRRVYSPHVDKDVEKKNRTAYFFVPLLMKRIILPLSNVKMEIEKFELKDSEVAPFLCEVTCWFRIENPDIAVEKLDIVDQGFESAVRGTLEEQVRGIARAAAMKQEILDIMRDRKTFGNGVEEEVNGALEEWGLELVKLEIVDFYDTDDSDVIKDYENKRKSQIEAESRKTVAAQNKEAEIAEAKSREASGIQKAQSDQAVQLADVERQKTVSIAEQDANTEVAERQRVANEKSVAAEEKLVVGRAQVQKNAIIEKADGESEAKRRIGQSEADVEAAKGKAEAEVIKSKGLSEAEATDKKAEALQKYNDAATTIEKINAEVKVKVAQAEAMARALQNANINIVGESEDAAGLFGVNFDAKAGAGFGQMIEAIEKTTGKTVGELVTGKNKEEEVE